MKSLRVWFNTLALGATLMFSVPNAKAQGAGMPRGFTYQGELEENGAPVSGNVTFAISITDENGNVLYSETFQSVAMTNGVFNLIIGGTTPFPANMTFNEQYFMTVVVTDGSGTTTLPPTAIESAPYAINSNTVNGISASLIPISGGLFPVPLTSDVTQYTGSVKIAPSFLPIIPNNLLQSADIVTINGIGPNTNGNFEIIGGSGITVTAGTNDITISGSVQGIVTNVLADSGLVAESTGSDGIVELRIANGGITSDMLASQLSIGSSANTSTALSVVGAEANGNEALLVEGGIGANNATGAADGTGLTSGSPQTYWADQVSVPSATGASILIYNTLISSKSTIVLTPVESSASAIELAITAQSAGTFTVSSTSTMGTSGGGTVTALNYLVINH